MNKKTFKNSDGVKKLIISIFGALIISAGCSSNVSPPPQPVAPSPAPTQASPIPVSPSPAPQTQSKLSEPISGALTRVTKKPFGIYITPATSPVQPEKFTGYHTGTDFETTAAEQNTDVSVYAACTGTLALKRFASGYGGVAVESCNLDGSPVTIIYGHLRLASIIPGTGDIVNEGDRIAVLGTGFSSETDGERKHLHFGIHKGSAVVIAGYVQNQSDLSGWLDPENYLK